MPLELPKIPTAHAPKQTPAALPELKQQAQQQLKRADADGSSFAAAPLARPAALSVLAPSAKGAPAPLTHAEMTAQLEPLIQQQVKELQAILDAQGLDPKTVSVLYNLDITGNAVQVCLACGQIGHDFRPTMVRQENPEINMLSESLVVFQEVASRLGLRYGLVAFDEDVLPIRAVAFPDVAENKETVLRRFETFLKRHDVKAVKDGVIMDWMAKEMAKWNPADATKAVVGEPNDRRAIETGQKLLKEAGGDGLRGMVVAKGQPAKSSLRTLEALARSQGVELSGIAVGTQAEAVAKTMFGRTSLAPDLHQLKTQLGKGMTSLVDRG